MLTTASDKSQIRLWTHKKGELWVFIVGDLHFIDRVITYHIILENE